MRFRYFLALVTILGYLVYFTTLKPTEEKATKEKETDAEDADNDETGAEETDAKKTDSEAKEIITYTAGSCRGRCKIFDLKIFDSGKVELNAIKNVGESGLRTFNISEEKVKELQSIIETQNSSSLKTKYLIKGNKGSQKFEIIIDGKSIIFHKKKAPKKLMNIKNALDDLIMVE